MANIALISYDNTSSALKNTLAAFQNLGHNVTVIVESALPSYDLLAFDLVAMTRYTRIASTTPTWYSQVKDYIDAGNPAFIGVPLYGSGVTRSFTYHMKMIDRENVSDQRFGIVKGETHYINETIASAVNVYLGSDYIAHAYVGYPHVTPSLAFKDDTTDNNPCLLVADVNTPLIDGTFSAGRMVYCGFLYGSKDYSTEGLTLLDRAINWLVPSTEQPQPTKNVKLGETDVTEILLGANPIQEIFLGTEPIQF